MLVQALVRVRAQVRVQTAVLVQVQIQVQVAVLVQAREPELVQEQKLEPVQTWVLELPREWEPMQARMLELPQVQELAAILELARELWVSRQLELR